MQPTLLSAALFAAGAAAHGRVTSPTPRPIGAAMKAACGQQVYTNQASDPNGNIQGMASVGASQSDFNAAACELFLCKGYKFADNAAANVQAYSAGQTVDFKVDIVAPHTGVANVSVVNTNTNAVIGSPLISFTNYASTATGIAANNTAFSVTIPSGLPADCATAGNCVLQWWWDARSVDQTYMSCVDFTTGSGSGSGSGSGNGTTGSTPTTGSSSSAATPTSPQRIVTAATAGATSSSTCGKRRRAYRA